MENFPPMASERRPKWKFRSLREVNQVANSILRYIMVNERSKRWGKVIEAYQRLLWVIDKKHFPSDFEVPSSYAVLLYELHFHLGLALQRLGLHRKSVHHYTEAIKAVSIPKGGCLAGCVTNSCMMTPLYSRRAFAYTMTGDMTSALRDAESAVVLDNKNPDVYCIRALVRSSRGEEKHALQDLDYALNLCPNHVCCLVVRGSITRPLSPREPGGLPRKNKYLAKAEKLNPDSQSYFNVDSFTHPHILDFYDRLLFTLLVPHTITDINLTPDKPSKKQIESNPEVYRSDSARSRSSLASSSPPAERVEPFRCGTPAAGDNVLAARRRHDYGEAVRKHNSRPKTASEYMARLEKERKLRILQTQRSQSAKASSQAASSRTVTFASDDVRPKPADVTRTTSSGRRTKTASTRAFIFETPTNYSIPVFQPMNVAEAPRMYYRPWQGDKLPVAEVPHPKPGPAFY